MTIQYPPVAWEAYFLLGADYPDGVYFPYPIADTPGTLVGSAPYFAVANDGNYHEDQWDFSEGDAMSGVVFDGTWSPGGQAVDIAVDWRVYIGTEVGDVNIDFFAPGVVEGRTFAHTGHGWVSGTSYLSEAPGVDAPAVSADFFGVEQSFVEIEVYGSNEDSSRDGFTFAVDLIRVYVITIGGVPLRLMQRGDGLGMGSGRILGTGTRQSSTRVFGAL